MKAARIVLTLALIGAVIYLSYELHETREALVTKQVRAEIEKVKARALAFYQLELDRKALDHSFKGSIRDFELRIVIPKDKDREFKEWMKDYGFDVSILTGRDMEYNGVGQSNGELFWKLRYK